MADTVINLVTPKYQPDETGVPRETVKVGPDLVCQAGSVTRAEFYGYGREGNRPEKVFTLFAGDYNGEPMIRHEGKTYSVYRDYHVPGTDYLELYVNQKGGTNGKGDTD